MSQASVKCTPLRSLGWGWGLLESLRGLSEGGAGSGNQRGIDGMEGGRGAGSQRGIMGWSSWDNGMGQASRKCTA